ncbi:MAG: lytic transglycosylase [Flaviaesturariibacter sp.]|nr:lytic transglycosylase [Flaviaesturariibacter sp.]
MKRLLLLTTLPLTAVLYSFAGKQQAYGSSQPLTDSTKQVSINPKDAFKDLFESSNTASFAFKLNSQAVTFVQDYMEGNTVRLTKMKTWGRPYFDLIDGVLAQYGLPTELKYLSVIESDLKSTAVSWVGAVGPWQLMPETARELGLRVNRKVDERTDYAKSTRAAAKHLNALYKEFNDWLLVIAAYNTGSGNVLAAIRKSGSRNFWALQSFLPAETRGHVKKFIATHYIMEGDGGMTTMTKSETDNHLQGLGSETTDGSVQTISGKYSASVIARVLQMDIAAFSKLNPAFDQQLSVNGTYNLRLPADKMVAFQTSKSVILEQSLQQLLAGASR